MTRRKARLIAFYLPQFHPVPENDRWWGPGFTEWTNVAKAKPLFRGHHQPNIPADLGFYDLRVAETRQRQAELARNAGIEAFAYWHYWFAGDRLLDRPFREVLQSGEPDFPFCLAWANETWSGIWHGAKDRILKEQTYPGAEDYKRHFDFLLSAFRDRRYFLVAGKPLLGIYRPEQIPNPVEAMSLWRQLAVKAGFPGLYLVGITSNSAWARADVSKLGMDAVTSTVMDDIRRRKPAFKRHLIPYLFRKQARIDAALSRLTNAPRWSYDYATVTGDYGRPDGLVGAWHPSVMPNWDNTPRSGRRGSILLRSTPELFRKHLRRALEFVSKQNPEKRIIFVKSWNEWAEGNYLEPDLRYGMQYLDVVRDEILDANT